MEDTFNACPFMPVKLGHLIRLTDVRNALLHKLSLIQSIMKIEVRRLNTRDNCSIFSCTCKITMNKKIKSIIFQTADEIVIQNSIPSFGDSS